MVFFLANQLDDVSPPMDSETFHRNESGPHVQWKEKLHAAEKQHFVGMFELLTRRKCPVLDIYRLF